MTNTLALDTSSHRLGVAVANADGVIGEYMTNLRKNHALRLMPTVESLLQEVEMVPKDLARIVVARGPGSYTGVRMAVTVAKTLAWTLEIPLVGVSTLMYMAQAGKYVAHAVVVPLIDARRGNIYTAAYRFEKGQTHVVLPEIHIHRDVWLQQLKERGEYCLFVGEDVSLHEEKIREVLGDKALFTAPQLASVRPGELCLLGEQVPPVESIHDFVPQYLQLAEAEVNWQRATERRLQ
ncbi:tRNA (adenosine(37)-N6)-threonylcarbamoyltransferase complex dimerization subunit type 1 TsaB [Bacillus sp. FSL W7-1360]